MEHLDILATASFWAAVLRIASPLIFATMGELICERAGVLNLGIEGIMVVGAFAGWIAVYAGLPLWGGVATALLTGMAFGLLHGLLCVPLGLSQHVVGLGITLLATASASYAYRLALPRVTTPPRIEPFAPLPLPGALAQTPLTYLAFADRRRHRLRPRPHPPRPRASAPSARTRRPSRPRASRSPRSASAPSPSAPA